MKRVLVILTGLLAILHIAGITPFYVAALQFIKQEAIIELGETNQLQAISISHAELKDQHIFNQLEENEFTYRGKRYDFASKECTPNGCIFYALEDEKENTLYAALALYYGNHTSGTSTPLGKLLKDFSKDYQPITPMADAFSGEVTTHQGFIVNPQTDPMKGHCNPPINPPDNRNTHC